MASSAPSSLSHNRSVRPQLLALLLLVAACGRTELDLLPDDGGAGGMPGVAGRGGAGVADAGGQTAGPIMCGQAICVPGAEACCFQANTQTCIPAQAQCSGASVACLDGAGCTGGRFCCLSLLGGSTSCQAAQLCSLTGGLFLCATDAQCPSMAPRCCRFGASGVCSAQSCP
jgi:hypothetical protein